MKPAIEGVKDFLDNKNGKNVWIYGSDLNVYVRKAFHLDNEKRIIKMFDIANICAKKPGTGAFAKFLKQVEEISPWPIYVESIENERLYLFLLKKGYKPAIYAHYCLIKIIKSKHKIEEAKKNNN